MLKNLIACLVLIWASALRAEPVTIAALGDSLTQGYGLVQEDGFVPRLESWLAENGSDVRVINAGVSGDTTAGGASRVGWTLTEDVDAMIVALGGNDVLRGIAPETARANLDAILMAARAQDVPVLLVGTPVPGNFGADYKRAFEAIYPELAAEYGTLHMGSFFEGLGTDDPAAAQAFMQPDGIHPNAEGVQRIVAAVGPQVQRLVSRVQSE
jgi:acyl-CoA thioesterase-1